MIFFPRLLSLGFVCLSRTREHNAHVCGLCFEIVERRAVQTWEYDRTRTMY